MATRATLCAMGVTVVSPPSASLLGHATLEELNVGSRIEEFIDTVGSPVLSSEQQVVLAAKTTENDVKTMLSST
jgi:hypothetical protein